MHLGSIQSVTYLLTDSSISSFQMNAFQCEFCYGHYKNSLSSNKKEADSAYFWCKLTYLDTNVLLTSIPVSACFLPWKRTFVTFVTQYLDIFICQLTCKHPDKKDSIQGTQGKSEIIAQGGPHQKRDIVDTKTHTLCAAGQNWTKQRAFPTMQGKGHKATG